MNNTMTRAMVIALALLLFSGLSRAEEFWAHRIAKQVDVAYGDHALQKMDVFVHGRRIGEPSYFAADQESRPTLMWIHGGGWVTGDKSSQISHFIPYLQRGWNVFNINYRQGADTAPEAVDDVMCAYKFVIEQLAERGQAPGQIVVSGTSAGGHLSLVVGLLNAHGDHPCRVATRPDAIVNWFGITDIEMVDEYLQGSRPQTNYARSWAGTASKLAEVSAAYSPMYLISDDAPPIISVHGTADTVVPYDQGESFHSSLTTPNELITLTGGNHSGFTDDQYQQAFSKIFAFLATH